MDNYPLNRTESLRNLKKPTDRRIRHFGDKPGFKSMVKKTEKESVTYEHFGGQFCALANTLQRLCKEKIAVLNENSYKWILSCVAIVSSNATVIPLNKEPIKKERHFFLERSEAAVLFY